MKPTVRLIIMMIILVSVALLGVNHIALAGSPCGSVPCIPSCGEIGPGAGGTINLGTSVVTVGDNSGYVDACAISCNDPASKFCGPAVYVKIMDITRKLELYSYPPEQICFANPFKGGIFRWSSLSDPQGLGPITPGGTWAQFPDFNQNGMICTLALEAGNFAVLGR